MATKKNCEEQLPETAEAVQQTEAVPAPDAGPAPAQEPQVQQVRRVPLYIPRAQGNDEPNLMVSVNGINYLLPKGKESMVPDFVAQEYRRSLRAQERMDRRIDELKEAAQVEKKQ